VVVTVNPLPAAVAGTDRAICLNASTTLGAAAVSGNTYSWTSVPAGFTSTAANPSVSPLVNTTYTVVETITATGCTNTHSVTVTVNPLPAAVAGADRAICLNGSTTIGAASITGSTYSWASVPAGYTSTVANPTVSPLVTTTYTVVETITATGCTNTHSVVVTVNPLPAAVAGNARSICLNGSTTLGATAVTGSTYSWTSVPSGFTSTEANPSVSPLVTTTYTVVETITATGCTNNHNVVVTVNPLPAAVAGTDRAICLNASTTLGAASVTGSTYSWTSVPSGFTSTVANPSVSPLVNTTYTVVETITATGCTNTHSVTVTVNPLPAAAAGSARSICLNGSTTIGATAVTGSTYSWTSVPSGFTSTEANPSVSPLATTTYTVVETITATGCTNNHSVVVTVNPLPAAAAGNDRAICLNASTTLGAAAVSGNTYSWTSVPAGFTSTAANPSVSPLVNTTYTVVETITATGCANTHSVTVTVNPLPSAVAGTDRAICLGGNTTLGAVLKSGAVNIFSWTSVPAGFTSTLANPIVSPAVTTTYTVVETITATGCTNTHSVTVTVNPLPSATAGADRAICFGTGTTLGAAAVTGNTYSWTSVPAGFTSTTANPYVSPTVTTTYTVVETITATGCTNTHSVVVTVNPIPVLSSTLTPAAICSGSTFSYTATSTTPGSAFGWSRGTLAGITPAGTTGTGNVSEVLTNTTPSPIDVTYGYTTTASGCSSAVENVIVTVKPMPVLSSSLTPPAIGNGDTFVYTATSATAATIFTWSRATVSGITEPGTTGTGNVSEVLSNPTTQPVNVTYVYTSSAGGCTNAGQNVVVTVNPTAELSSTLTPPALCSAATFTYIPASATPGATFTWSRATLAGIIPSGTTGAGNVSEVLINTTTAPIEVTYVYTTSVGGFSGTPQNVVVPINPTPMLSSTLSPPPVCSGSAFVYLATSATTGSTFGWSRATKPGITPPGTSGTGNVSEVLTNTTASPIAVTYVYTTTANGCSNTAQNVVVSVRPLPAAVAGNARTICPGSPTTLGAAAVPGSTYSWTSVPAGFTSATANPSVSPTVTTTYTVVETSGATGCTNSHSVVVTVNPALPVSVTIAADATDVCIGTLVTVTATPVNGGSGPAYQWKLNGTDVPGATNSIYSFNLTATGTEVTCLMTSNATFCTTGNPALSNVVTITVPDLCPTVTIVGNVIAGETRCINATETITVAGTEPFVVHDGGSVTMIAGQNIIYLPGTTVEPGGYMHGKIFDGTYCGLITAPIATATSTEEEIPVMLTVNNFRLYPNPTTGKFTIEQTGGALIDIVRVEIYGMLGGKVMSGQISSEKKHEFSIAEFPAGVYFVKIFAGVEARTIKLIKTN